MPSKKVTDMTPEEHAAHKAHMRAYCAANRAKINAQQTALYHQNKEHRSEQNKGYYLKHRDKKIAYAAKWQSENREKCTEARRRFRARNPHKDREYFEQNRPKYAAQRAMRKAGTIAATPRWGEKFLIEEAYDLAQRRTRVTGFEWHVDHIVPLKAKSVCGLHVENNLQVIPGVENLRKGNRVPLGGYERRSTFGLHI